MKRFLIHTPVNGAEGTQIWYVDSETEAQALKEYKAGNGDIYASEVEVTSLGEPSIEGFTTLDDFGDSAQAPQHDCTRSHPHENMSKECELRTEIARLQNQLAQEKPEPVAWRPAFTHEGYATEGTWNTGKPTKEDVEFWGKTKFGIEYAYAYPPQPKESEQLHPSEDVSIGVDVKPEGTHVVAIRSYRNGANVVIYSQFHPAPQPKEPEQEPVATMPSNTRYTVAVEGRAQTYWDNIHDAITAAQRAVYSGPDNTTRALDDLKAGRIAEWSYGFSAVRIYPPQPKEDSVWSPDECARVVKTLKFLQGIAERGEGRAMREDETLEQFVLGCVKQLEQEVLKLRGESGVLVGLLGAALQVIETVDGDDAAECQQLMELQNKITYAIRAAASGIKVDA